jgi:hypothetical protein
MLQEKKGKTMTKLDIRRTRRKERIPRFGRKMEKSTRKRKMYLEAVYIYIYYILSPLFPAGT